MNPQWDTPPNGDFARYVEQLSAHAAIVRHASEADSAHAMDGGLMPTEASPGAVATGRASLRQRLAARAPGATQGAVATAGASGGAGAAVPGDLLRGAAVVWFMVLVAMLILDAPFGLFLLVAAAGMWVAKRMRRRILPAGMNSWREWFEDIARKAAEQQRTHQGK